MQETVRWGSDVLVRQLASLGIEYVALTPGASFRGLHDSLVAFAQDGAPEMLVCLHEEHAAAIAHGYAKVRGEPIAVALHTAVGVMHASMALFNAYCDRVPLLALAGQGPLDAARRRPWIEWLHTSADLPGLVRPFLKWDDEPHSVPALIESLRRAHGLCRQLPAGPVLISLDVTLQEEQLTRAEQAAASAMDGPMMYTDAIPDVNALVDALCGARRPVLLMGRMSRSVEGWNERIRLAELLGASVITDLRVGATFPTDHQCHVGAPGFSLDASARQCLANADVIVSLDWIDLAGALQAAGGEATVKAKVFNVSADSYTHNGWTKDHQGLPAGVHHLLGSPEAAVRRILALMADRGVSPARKDERCAAPDPIAASDTSEEPEDRLGLRDVAVAVREALVDADPCYIRLPLGWPGDVLQFRSPLDYLGYDGGGGVGSGPGMAVGAALGLQGTGRLSVAVLGDGDLLMGCTALWTAAQHNIGLLVVVANNRAYFNDVLHQGVVAGVRGRPAENRWVGQVIDDPPVDIPGLCHALGAHTFPTVSSLAALRAALSEARDRVMDGEVVVVDVLTRAEYDSGASGTVVGVRRSQERTVRAG